MPIQCINYAKCGNNVGGYINPRLNTVSVISCSAECFDEVTDKIEKEVKTRREAFNGSEA